MDYRLALLGIVESGAYDYYHARLSQRRVFAEYELQLVQAIVSRRLPVEDVHEIGCGWGQLIFLLAWHRYRAAGFEIDRKRFAGGKSLLSVLRDVDPERAARATLRMEFFPPLDRPPKERSLVIATNIVTENPTYIEHQMIWALRHYQYALLDVERFCQIRGPDEQKAFLDRLQASGFRNHGLFCDAGSEGQFYLLEPERGAEGWLGRER
jgi:hypothetical protein